jgi:hypothetical protein
LWTGNAGGIAGAISGMVIIPQDAIKTRQQAHLGSVPLTIVESTKQLMKEGGFKRFF